MRVVARLQGRFMLDTHAVARSPTDAEFTSAQADAITNAVRLAAEWGGRSRVEPRPVCCDISGRSGPQHPPSLPGGKVRPASSLLPRAPRLLAGTVVGRSVESPHPAGEREREREVIGARIGRRLSGILRESC